MCGEGTAGRCEMPDVAKLLEPVQTGASLGRNIVQNQPDVEALAFVTRDFALTEAKHSELRIPGKDWLSLQVCLVGVSKAGFSRVPYAANKKKGEKEVNLKGLYEDTKDNSGTTFFTFEKGKTNKDRGERLESIELEDGVTADGSAVVGPGMCFSAFMRPDIYGSDSKFFVDDAAARAAFAEDGVLRKHTFVYLQLSSQNVNQARQGNLVKIKRLKLVTDAYTSVANLTQLFPESIPAFDAIQERSKGTPVLTKQVYAGNNSFLRVSPSPQAFVSLDETGEFCVCSHVGAQGIDSVKVPLKLIHDATSTSDVMRACKIASIAFAMQAVSMIVQSNERNSVIMSGETDSWPHEAVFMYIDPNKMLGLDAIEEQQTAVQATGQQGQVVSTANVAMKYENNRMTWTVLANKVRVESGGDRGIVFSLNTEKRIMLETQGWNKSPARFLSDGCAGDYYKLSVYLVDVSASDATLDGHNSLLSLRPPIATPVITLQLFPGLASARCSKKRPRFEAVDDTFDSFSEAEADAEAEGQAESDEALAEAPVRVSSKRLRGRGRDDADTSDEA